MPTVHVRANEVDREAAASALRLIAREVAAAVPCDIGSVWCTFSSVDLQTVGDDVREGEGRIVYVDVWIRAREDGGAATRTLEVACRAAAEGCGTPVEDVWGTLRPVESRRVFAGGSLIVD